MGVHPGWGVGMMEAPPAYSRMSKPSTTLTNPSQFTSPNFGEPEPRIGQPPGGVNGKPAAARTGRRASRPSIAPSQFKSPCL